MTDPETCPRCESTDLTGLSFSTTHGDADQTQCDDCGHVWGDGLPDSQAKRLPDGFEDCSLCEGIGERFGVYACGRCHGAGIVQTALLG